MERHFILATAGHVDHGKSALVQALTDVDPDRLPEEKARGITIELGFAELTLTSEKTPDDRLRLGMIDVPGHEDFVKNMVAGVGCVNLGLIVVAADDGWMPQTEEHLQILEYLGVKEVIVVLNKIDLAQDDEAFLQEVIRDELSESAFSGAPIIATSTVTGQGMAELKQLLWDRFNGLPDADDRGKPRLSVDRAFSVKGHGTVVTGSLIDGVLESNQSIVVQPKGEASRIRSLQSFGQDVSIAKPGSRVAINLANVSIRRSGAAAHEGVGRGDVITLPATALATRVIDCLIAKSNRLIAKSTPSSKPLKHGARIRLHHGSRNTPGRIFFLDVPELKAGEEAPAEIRLEDEVMVLTGDRFVLRDWSEIHTLAGGLVVDAEGEVRRFRRPEQREFFGACQATSDRLPALLGAFLGRDKMSAPASLLRHSCFSSETIHAAVQALALEKKVVEMDEWIFESVFWDQQLMLAGEAVDGFHRSHSELLGISPTELRSHLDSRWANGDGFGVLVRAMERNGFCGEGTVIRRTEHRISLPSDLEPAVNRLRLSLGEKLLEPPARKQLIGSSLDERAMRFLSDVGEVVDVGEELVFLKNGFEQLDSLVCGFLSDRGGGTVSELRQHTGVSRRIILPILEHLDAAGVTVRDGDVRRLKSASA